MSNIQNILFRYRMKQGAQKIIVYLMILIIIAVVVFPFYWLITTSIKFEGDMQTFPPIFFPARTTFQHYIDVFVKSGIGKNLRNSLVVAVSTTFLSVLFGSLAAYSIAKSYLARKFRTGFLVAVLVIRIFPPVVTTMPYFLIITRLGLYDTLISMIITYVAYCLPFVIWLMLGFFQEMPHEIEKASIVDGCSVWQRFYRISLPLTLPGLATTSVFCFILGWNEFLYASVLTSQNAKTLPVVIASYISDQRIQWGPMTATGVLLVIPVLIFAIAAQKYLVRGLTFGAVKG